MKGGLPDLAFERIAVALRRDGTVTDDQSSPVRGFGSAALKVRGKIFAMPSQGTVVLKLPRERVSALVASGAGAPYDPGHGRVMREWVALRGEEDEWLSLAREAYAFVAQRGRAK
jgi:TfoX/Sxy family transcriptional regulator of competence genes